MSLSAKSAAVIARSWKIEAIPHIPDGIWGEIGAVSAQETGILRMGKACKILEKILLYQNRTVLKPKPTLRAALPRHYPEINTLG